VGNGEYVPVAISRLIRAPADVIFRVLTDPRRHLELDGSGMLRGAVTEERVTGVGDVFVMAMYFSAHGDYEMNNHVVEYEEDRRIGWEPEAGRGHPDEHLEGERRWGHRWTFELTPEGPDSTTVTEIYDCSRLPQDERLGMQDGAIWVESMAKTLERLDGLCTG
jgi:uncharacterized protein YndB with AHSA1/START domain